MISWQWNRIRARISDLFRSVLHDLPQIGKHLLFLSILVLALRSLASYLRSGHLGLVGWIYPERRHLVDVIAITLAICGIFYAVRQDIQSSEQAENFENKLTELRAVETGIAAEVTRLKEMSEKLKNLEDSQATTRIEGFPNVVARLNALFCGARRLDILIDCIDYGSFFAPSYHWDFHSSLVKIAERGREKGHVRILVCGQYPHAITSSNTNDEQRDKKTEEYLKYLRGDKGFMDFMKHMQERAMNEAGFVTAFKETWLRPDMAHDIPDEITRCLSWFSASGMPDDARGVDNVTVETLQQFRQLWFGIDFIRAKVSIYGSPRSEDFFIWLRDHLDDKMMTHVAAFTWAVAARGSTQFCSRTSDPANLGAFRALFDRKWKDAADARKEHRQCKARDTNIKPTWDDFLGDCEVKYPGVSASGFENSWLD